MTEPWVSVEDVAAHLGVQKDSMFQWIDAKGLHSYLIGRLWKFKLSEVNAWVSGRGGLEGHETPRTSRES